LPGRQAKFGPLAGTLILAFVWAAWHDPQYMMPDWAAQNGGFNLEGVTLFNLRSLSIGSWTMSWAAD
jgi:uncharacterized protein